MKFMSRVVKESVKNFNQAMSKAQCFDFCANLHRVPNCPYFHLPCRNFYVNLACGVCFEGDFRCSWLPSWVKCGCRGVYAILRDGRLHV